MDILLNFLLETIQDPLLLYTLCTVILFGVGNFILFIWCIGKKLVKMLKFMFTDMREKRKKRHEKERSNTNEN